MVELLVMLTLTSIGILAAVSLRIIFHFKMKYYKILIIILLQNSTRAMAAQPELYSPASRSVFYHTLGSMFCGKMLRGTQSGTY